MIESSLLQEQIHSPLTRELSTILLNDLYLHFLFFFAIVISPIPLGPTSKVAAWQIWRDGESNQVEARSLSARSAGRLFQFYKTETFQHFFFKQKHHQQLLQQQWNFKKMGSWQIPARSRRAFSYVAHFRYFSIF